ncbi:hypothetical protein FRB94_005755 [Tulasnella sp. JGI-2019a]|nr:hypothetical protein FRB94_005755 [Tulasnella sp. JGI-2019a]
MSDALDVAKLGLTALSIGLQASPIPEPFKSAVSGIPGAVLQIIEIVEARKKSAILVIARQLSSWQSGQLRPAIALAIEENPDIAQMTPGDQFQKLILGPLESLGSACPTLVVIFDALDECDPTYAGTLLRLVGRGLGTFPSAVKFLITSRGEP